MTSCGFLSRNLSSSFSQFPHIFPLHRSANEPLLFPMTAATTMTTIADAAKTCASVLCQTTALPTSLRCRLPEPCRLRLLRILLDLSIDLLATLISPTNLSPLPFPRVGVVISSRISLRKNPPPLARRRRGGGDSRPSSLPSDPPSR